MNSTKNRNKNTDIYSFLKNYKFNKNEKSIKVSQFRDTIISYINNNLIDINEEVLKPDKNGKYFKTRVELKKIIFYVLYLMKQTKNGNLQKIINFIVQHLFFINDINKKINYSILEYICDINNLFGLSLKFTLLNIINKNIIQKFHNNNSIQNLKYSFFEKGVTTQTKKNILNKKDIQIFFNNIDIKKIIKNDVDINNKNEEDYIIKYFKFYIDQINYDYERAWDCFICNQYIEYNNKFIQNILNKLQNITKNNVIIMFIFSILSQSFWGEFKSSNNKELNYSYEFSLRHKIYHYSMLKLQLSQITEGITQFINIRKNNDNNILVTSNNYYCIIEINDISNKISNKIYGIFIHTRTYELNDTNYSVKDNYDTYIYDTSFMNLINKKLLYINENTHKNSNLDNDLKKLFEYEQLTLTKFLKIMLESNIMTKQIHQEYLNKKQQELQPHTQTQTQTRLEKLQSLFSRKIKK